jgi:hypothetical protein
MESGSLSLGHIRKASHEKAAKVVAWFESYGEARFDYAPPGKWTAGQHLDHLIRSAKEVNKALGLPKFILRLAFGKPNRPVRDYETVKAKYDQGLASGVKASGKFIPPQIDRSQQAKVIQSYWDLQLKFERTLQKWNDTSIDKYLLPHPALGKMYVREMLFFVIFHTEHHLHILEDRYMPDQPLG